MEQLVQVCCYFSMILETAWVKIFLAMRLSPPKKGVALLYNISIQTFYDILGIVPCVFGEVVHKTQFRIR